jgi:CIC family chloride channel protein
LASRIRRALAIFKEMDIEQVRRWTLFSLVIGAASGLCAVAFYVGLSASLDYLLGGIGGYYPPLAGGESPIFSRPALHLGKWLVLVVPAVGGLLAGLIVYRFAPEAEGHGTDAVIDAYNNKRGHIRKRVPIIKALASMLTIGTGGSAGREGPIAQTGAGIGSTLASYLKLSDRDRRIMVICGMAAGIGSIFRAPFGGALFAIEVLYKRDMETEGLVPAFISSTIAYSVFGSFLGWGHVFTSPSFSFSHPEELLFFGILGLLCAATAIVFVVVFFGFRNKVFKPLKIKPHFKPAIGGLLVGAIALAFPQVLGVGYGWIQMAISGDLVKLSIIMMMVLIPAKIVATSLTVGSGGSGGVFAPSLFIGAMVGGAFGQTMSTIFPGTIAQPEAFVLVGMGALLAGAAKVPITAIVMVSEMAGNYNLLVPLMVASTIAYMLAGKWTIYEKQAESRATSPAHRREMTVDVLERAMVKDSMTLDVVSVNPQSDVSSVMKLIHELGHTGYPVVDNGKLVGIVTFEDVEEIPVEKRQSTQVKDVMTTKVIVAKPTDSLEDALKKIVARDIEKLPVVDAVNPSKLVGLITIYDIVRTHAKLSAQR